MNAGARGSDVSRIISPLRLYWKQRIGDVLWPQLQAFRSVRM
ncbi:hypothetical protein [Paenibacillus pini]